MKIHKYYGIIFILKKIYIIDIYFFLYYEKISFKFEIFMMKNTKIESYT